MKTDKKTFEDVEPLLVQGRLSAAISILDNAIIAYPQLGRFKAPLEQLRQGYGYMSSYALQGLPDPGLAESLGIAVEGVRSLMDAMIRELHVADASTLYFSTVRYEQSASATSLQALAEEYRRLIHRLSLVALAENAAQASADLTLRAEQLERRLFNKVWTLYPLESPEDAELRSLMSDPSLPASVKSLLVSAILMGAMEIHDERRLLLLMDIYADNGEADVAVRALCALLVVMWLYRGRTMSPRLRHRLDALMETPGWDADVRMATMQFVRSRDTERITRKFNEEVIPEMMKLRPEFEKLKDKPIDPEDIEMNPEWAEMLDRSGIADKLKEMQEMQEDGADVMMATFSKLKTFPFFNDMANWFLPFLPGHSQVAGAAPAELAPLVDVLTSAPMMCDSDKYSIALSLSQVPAAQRDALIGQLKMQGEQLQAMSMARAGSPGAGREELAANYVRILYRFFKLFRRKGEFTDPFASGLNIPAAPMLEQVFDDPDTLSVIAEFYFKRGYWADALEVFRRLSRLEGTSASMLQKMGYCEQSLGHINAALALYEQAEMLDSSSRWTIKRLAWCYRELGNWEKALTYYKMLTQDRPDDAALALNIGLSLVKLRRYDEAINYLFKAEFYATGGEKATRALAWCTLLGGDYDRCTKYTATLLASASPRPVDYLNAGHLSLLTGHPDEAVDHYVEAIRGMDKDASRFLRQFSADRDTITAFASIEPALLDIVTDTALSRALAAP